MKNARLSDPVKIVVVGAGVIGRRHINVIRQEPAADLAAIVDPAPQTAVLAADLGVAHYSTAEAMLDDNRPDAAIVATPNVMHMPVGCACAAKGVHILVEKPIAESMESAARLVAESRRAGIHLLVGHHRRYHPYVQRGRELIRNGTLGQVTAVAAIWAARKPDTYFDVQWRTQPGGGPVLINTIHDIDNLRFLVGEIVAVRALTSNLARGFGVEDTAGLLLRFDNGAIGTVTVTDTAPSPWNWETSSGESPNIPHVTRNCYTIFGTEASMGFPNLELWRYRGRGWQDPLHSECERTRKIDPIAEQLRHFIAVMRGEATPIISGEDASRTLAATLAVAEAAATGGEVTLEDQAGQDSSISEAI